MTTNFEKANAKEFRILRGGGYSAIHIWLKNHYGKANHCENIRCKKISKQFNWAKLKGKPYTHNRNNFWMLCNSCHIFYDYKPEWGRKISIGNLGKVKSNTHRQNISEALKKDYKDGRRICPIKALTAGRIANSKFKKDEILAIREECKNGISQQDLAKKYKVAQALISKIKNRIIYKYVK